MKLQTRVKTAVKVLVDELMVSFPIDVYEAQRELSELLQSSEMIREIRAKVEIKFMEEVENEG